jgi:hypothetical protein
MKGEYKKALDFVNKNMKVLSEIIKKTQDAKKKTGNTNK